jgi:hypothetical protein
MIVFTAVQYINTEFYLCLFHFVLDLVLEYYVVHHPQIHQSSEMRSRKMTNKLPLHVRCKLKERRADSLHV